VFTSIDRLEETVSLGSIDCTLHLADVYERVPGSSSQGTLIAG